MLNEAEHPAGFEDTTDFCEGGVHVGNSAERPGGQNRVELLPVFLAAEGLSIGRIGVIAAAYPASWGHRPARDGSLVRQRRPQPLIVVGLWLQALGIAADAFDARAAILVAAALTAGSGVIVARRMRDVTRPP